MGRIKSTVTATVAASLLIAGVAAAQVEDKATVITFGSPVSLPGLTLPAGTYLFRLADTQASRNIVQVFDRDRTKIYATILAIRAERNEIADDPLVMFRETPSDRPPAIRYWYFAGENTGEEFAYPKAQATQIARASGESVLAVESNSADIEEMRKGEMTHVNPTTTETPESSEQPAAAEPAAPPRPSQTTAPTPSEDRPAVDTTERTPPAATGTSGTQPQQPSTSSRRELPKTASQLPLVGLLGLVALTGLLVVRMRRAWL